MTSMLGIVLSLVLLMLLAYRGVSLLVLAPVMALVAALFSPDVPWMASYTQVYMKALAGFVWSYFPLFLLGALFGQLMDASGAARAIAGAIVRALGAQHAVLAVVLACAVLTYGGVSLFVVAFAVYPISAALFRAADLPKRLIPATVALGAFTFTMTALPGTPSIQNAIPMPYFGTTPFAAPGLGWIGGAVMGGLGLAWITWRARAAAAAGEGYGLDTAVNRGESPLPTQPSLAPEMLGLEMPLLLALSPVVVVIVLNYALSVWFWPTQDTSYLAQARYGATTQSAVRGLWSVIGALSVALVWMMGVQVWRRQHASLPSCLEAGAESALLPILNTASQVGYGAVIASLAGFGFIRDAVLSLAPGQPLVSMSVAVNILAGMTGSASGGMSIALETLGANWLAMGKAAGVAPELMHRVIAIATGGLDALPHNGAVITLLSICQLSHRQSYGDIAMVAVVFPLVSLAAVVALGSAFGAF